MTDPTFPNTQQDPINTPPPTFPEMTDIPAVPQTQQETTTTTTPPVTNIQTEEITQPPVDIPPMVTTEKKPKKKGTLIATILGIFLLVGAVGAGVVLINQNQDIREKASGQCSCIGGVGDQVITGTCDEGGDCICPGRYSEYENYCDSTPPTLPPTSSCVDEFGDCGSNSNCCSGLSCVNRKCQENVVPTPGSTKTPAPPSCLDEFDTCSVTNDTCCDGLKCVSGKCQENVPSPQAGTTTVSVDYCAKIIKSSTSIGCPTDLFNAGTCWVTHFWCPDMTYDQAHDGCPSASYGGTENTLAIKVQSASFSKSCGVEQIDVYYPDCTDLTKKFISQVDPPCNTSTAPPSDITAACTSIKVYDSEWNLIPSGELPLLSTGDQIYFTVSGTPADKITKARFTINGTVGAEVTTKKTGTSEYYTQYTIPEGVTSFTVSAQIYHVTLGWF